MNEIELKEYRNLIEPLFREVFKEDFHTKKLLAVMEAVGPKKLVSMLTYWKICGLNEPAIGKRRNPYGLILKVAHNWKVDSTTTN
jgi:hypothetical protein